MRGILRAFAGMKIRSLKRKSHKTSLMILEAIGDFLDAELDSSEKNWIDKIESVRNRQNRSTEKITIMDFGFGKTSHLRTPEQIKNGIPIERAVGKLSQKASKSVFWRKLLFTIIRKYKTKNCLEMGTCFGISTSYQAAALKLNQSGQIVTLEGAESLADRACLNFEELGLDNIRLVKGRFQDTLADTLKEIGPLDYAFIDGHHDEKATVEYFEIIIPYMSEKSVLVFDDINWSAGMKRAWKEIISDDRLDVVVDLLKVGICVIDPECDKKQRFRIPLL